MRVRRAGVPVLAAAVLLASCAGHAPKRPLAPGYYIFDSPRLGITRRIIIAAGNRRASYDVWRVSDGDDGTARHAHYDLIASDDVPTSGDFSITQDGSDCGTLSIEPYQDQFGIGGDTLTVRYGLAIEHFHVLRSGDASRYRQYDDALTRGIEEVAADAPGLYDHLSIFGKVFYSELNPSCAYD